MTTPSNALDAARSTGGAPLARLGALAASVGILHILAVFSWSSVNRVDTLERVRNRLPVNAMVVLPPARPESHFAAFEPADFLIAACRFDTNAGAVTVRAVLPEPGWTLSLYSEAGESFYIVPAQEQRRVEIAIRIVPPETGVFVAPQVLVSDLNLSAVPAPTATGLVVVRAPDKGLAFQSEVTAQLRGASCAQRRG